MKRTVTVSGQGASTVVPDTAVVRVAAAHRAAGVAEAFAGADSAVESMAEVARRHTEQRRISSTDVSVWPAYDQQGQPSGFEARHGLRVVVPDIAAAGRLLGELAVEVGDRLQVESVSLEVGDQASAREDARAAAFADARSRAEQLAALSGSAVGPVVSIAEGGFVEGPVEQAVSLRSAAKDTAFQPGERAVATSVTVTWELVPV